MHRLPLQFADARFLKRSRTRTPQAKPARARLLAALCILLMVVSACVQASHVHDDGGPSLTASSQSKVPAHAPDHAPGSTPASTDHCLLCVAMHAAMPAASGVALVLVQYRQPALALPIATFRLRQVSFDLFSRPPPATPNPAR